MVSEKVRRLSFTHPLILAHLVREMVDLGYKAAIVSVDLEQGHRDWVGQELV